MTYLITVKWYDGTFDEFIEVGTYLDVLDAAKCTAEQSEVEWVEIHRKYSETCYVFMKRIEH